MSRIEACFAGLSGRKAMIAYITAGDPDPACTVTLMHAMVAAGVDVIELGVPFSDPMADGPVIQRASERALAHHVSLRGVLSMVSEFRAGNARTPVVLMGYLNPIEVLGYGAFARSAVEAGVDGVLTVDMPPEEAGDYVVELQTAGLAPIFLIAPTTTDERVAKICALARGFVYYVSLKGVTGAAHHRRGAATGGTSAGRPSSPPGSSAGIAGTACEVAPYAPPGAAPRPKTAAAGDVAPQGAYA